MTLLTSLRAKLFPAATQTGGVSTAGASTLVRSDFAGMMRSAGAQSTDAETQPKSSTPTVASEAKPTQDVAVALASRPGAIVAPAEETPVVAKEEAALPGMAAALPVETDGDVAPTDDEAEVATTDAAANDDAQAPVAPAPTPPIQPAMVANIPQGVVASVPPVDTASGEKAKAASVATQTSIMVQVAEAKEPAKAGKFEPLSLLQMVRDHMTVRSPRAKESAANDMVAATASADTGASAALLSNLTPGATAAPVATAAPQATLAQPTATMPTVDLSASLGAQVVDMGVSGQWIDGLARDIAGLSANGAQGRFQINADQLGPIQVDIRQGSDGAAVSLTVATEVAELALRQDSDRLKLDAGLSAVRISEVKIERAPHVAEAARADSAGNQTSSQQQSQQQGQTAGWQGQGQGQGMGQSSAQSHMQGRGQSRENIASDLKGSGDAVVLNHEQAADMSGDLPRARFA